MGVLAISKRGRATVRHGVRFRSRFESSVAASLDLAGVGWEYEPVELPYAVPHLAVPDFRLASGVFVEAKGYFPTEDRRAFLALIATHPRFDFRLCFQNASSRIGKGTRFPTNYGEWCDKHGIEWCQGPSLPASWLEGAVLG